MLPAAFKNRTVTLAGPLHLPEDFNENSTDAAIKGIDKIGQVPVQVFEKDHAACHHNMHTQTFLPLAPENQAGEKRAFHYAIASEVLVQNSFANTKK
jgi:hypothetical protein